MTALEGIQRERLEHILEVRRRMINSDPVTNDELAETIRELRLYKAEEWRSMHWAAKAWAIFLSKFYRVFPWIWEWRENR